MINVGDGWISYNPKQYRYNIGMVSIDKEMIDYFVFCCQKVFDIVPKVYLTKSNNPNWNDRYFVYLCRKVIAEYFLGLAPLDFYRDQTCQIIPCVFDYPIDLKTSYLQAFFDSQGSVYLTNNTILGAKKQQEALIGIQQLLNSIDIKSSIKRGAITIYNKSIPKYKNLIGFQCQRKMDKLNQIPDPYYQREFTKEEVNQIINLYNKKVSWRKIAQSLNCSKGAIQYRIEKHCKHSPLPIAVHAPTTISPPLGTASSRL